MECKPFLTRPKKDLGNLWNLNLPRWKDTPDFEKIEDLFFEFSSGFINDPHAWWLLLRYFDDDKKWKTLIDEFGIKTTDPYLDFEPLLWYERQT